MRLRILVLALVILPIVFSCARKLPPPGGPEDKTAPEILYTSPENESIGVDLTPEIVIGFSERMDKKSLANAIFMAPPTEGALRIRWKKNDLILSFSDSLQIDRTYLVTIGSGAADEHRNKLINSHTLAFSTGESLDSGRIAGLVRSGGKPFAGATVAAYYLSELDTIDVTSSQPQYFTQTGSDGSFELNYVSSGQYILFAFDDGNHNRRWTPPKEKIALPVAPIILDQGAITSLDNDMDLFARDTALLKVKHALINQDLLIESELTGMALNHEAEQCEIRLIRSDMSDTVTIDRIFAMSDTVDSFVGIMPELTDVEELYLRIDKLTDIYGNECNIIDDSILLLYPVGGDRKPPDVKDVSSSDGAHGVLTDRDITIHFTEPIMVVGDRAGLVLVDPDSMFMSCGYEQLDPFTLQFRSDDTLRQATGYTGYLDLAYISDRFGNAHSDSVYSFRVHTPNFDSLGSFSGTVVSASMFRQTPPVIHFRHLPRGEWRKLDYDTEGRFHIDVIPGIYVFTGFYDRNGDGYLSPGTFSPFEYAEPVAVFGDTITVRSRFETEDIKLQVK